MRELGRDPRTSAFVSGDGCPSGYFYSLLMAEYADDEGIISKLACVGDEADLTELAGWIKDVASAVEDGKVSRAYELLTKADRVAKEVGIARNNPAIVLTMMNAAGAIRALTRLDHDEIKESCKQSAEDFGRFLEALARDVGEKAAPLAEAMSNAVDRFVTIAGTKLPTIVEIARSQEAPDGEEGTRRVKQALSTAKRALKKL